MKLEIGEKRSLFAISDFLLSAIQINQGIINPVLIPLDLTKLKHGAEINLQVDPMTQPLSTAIRPG